MERIGRYQVHGEVARGGMGAVYRASAPDGRAVALKLLLAASSPTQRRRIATEVQTLLRLRHPNLVALLDAGDQEGVPYLVTEWIEGETLHARIARAGPLDPRSAVELIQRLASALEHCHAQGVLHRDLKPANVLLRGSDGEPLLTDFGLAKDVAGDASLSQTRAGTWLGTPGWWPPEQARGELQAIGPRSDVYGLGALLYGALTGHPPQDGVDIQEVLRALDRPPIPPSRRGRCPRWLDGPCLRALALDPAARQAGPAELARDLALAAGRRPRRAGRALALATLLAGCAAAIPLLLGRQPAPLLTSTSTAAAAGSPTTTPTTPAEAAIAEVTARLDAGDLVGARESAERAIALAPAHPLGWACRAQVLERQGRREEALADWDRAIGLEPRYAPFHHMRGNLLAQLERRGKALADWERAIELDPTHVPARYNRALAMGAMGRVDEELAEYDRLLALDPSHARALVNRGLLHANQGRPTEALLDYDQAIRVDPDLAQAWANRGLLRQRMGKDLEAIADHDRALALDPSMVQSWVERGIARASLGRWEEALADQDQALALDPRSTKAMVHRGTARAKLGRYEEALQDLDRAIELDPNSAWKRVQRARVRLEQGRPREALVDLDLATKLDPRNAEARRLHARALEALGGR